MILVDTSVWIEHFRRENERLTSLLLADQVLVHPFVIGELACGNIPNRGTTLDDLEDQAPAPVALDDEVLQMIEMFHLYDTGLGYVDAHLLAAARLARCTIWSLDSAVTRAAFRLGLAG